MPCDSIILNQVHLGLANKELLAAALRDMGAVDIGQSGQGEMAFALDGRRYSVNQNGDLQGQDRNIGATADRIKQAYSGQVVKRAASRFGWNVKTTQRNRMVVTKRS
jgi:hypothetical protein